MSYKVVLSMEAVEDVLRITMASGAKSKIVIASSQIQEALRADPAEAGEHLSEGLYYIGEFTCRSRLTSQTKRDSHSRAVCAEAIRSRTKICLANEVQSGRA